MTTTSSLPSAEGTNYGSIQDNNNNNNDPKKKRILIIGGGAAGMACAYSLSRFPEKFEVNLWEKESVAGGVATSEEIETGDAENGNKARTFWMNDGVQGGSTTYRNTLLLHKHFGFEPQKVGFKVCFGKDNLAWTNYSSKPSELVVKLQPEIKRFGRILRWINRLEFFTIFWPIESCLKFFRFSEEFRTGMVYPLTALFFGTGNQTPQVASAIVARVFLDEHLRLFDYDPERLLSQEPEMFAFKRLGEIYSQMTKTIPASFHLNRSAAKVTRFSTHAEVTDSEGNTEKFDDVVFACNADVALKLLDKPTFWERKCLGNVKYYDDITVTHQDGEYMDKHYEMNHDKENEKKNDDMYYIRTDPRDRSKCEMSFNLSNYQPQLSPCKPNVYQTIFLNKKEDHLWTMGEIKKEKILFQKWWHQFAHEASHFYSVVPFVRFLQNKKKHSWFCGAYTLVNTHEIATISGLAVAHRLGAPYPFAHDELAKRQFDQYLTVIHGVLFPWLWRSN